VHIQETFKVELLTSENGSEYKERADVVFLFDDFMSLEFNDLEMSDKRILGPTVVFECASAGKVGTLSLKRVRLECASRSCRCRENVAPCSASR
jgi:hypothetical protein